jgi:uncharacterized membrane-anchored protein
MSASFILMITRLLFCLILMMITVGGVAQESGSSIPAETRLAADSLKFQTGQIVIGKDLATLTLPESFCYLSPDDTDTLLVKCWGNPPHDDKTLGAIVPKGFHPFSDASTWAVIITYENDGHIKDQDADSIDYDKLLKDMRQGMEDFNKQRIKDGYETIKLIGWATPPRYDKEGKKLYWAKELEFGENSAHTLNYNVRALGREGVLNLNAVAGMNDLKTIEEATPTLLGMVEFNKGKRYADYNPTTDKLAEYGLAALVLGGVAAKTGLFKALFVGLLAFKKFIILGVISAAAGIKKIFFGGTKGSS